MTARRRMSVAMVWLMVVSTTAGRSDAEAQSLQSEPWWNELGHEPFAGAYVRQRAADAAARLLSEDPFSVSAVTLLMRADRVDDAMTLVEEISRARPELLLTAFETLGEFHTLAEDPKAESRNARLKALREQVARATKSTATPVARTSEPVVAGQTQDDESERALLHARQELERASASLKLRNWSARNVAAALAPGRKLLTDLAERDRGRYGRRALELLARTEFEAGQVREAMDHYVLIEQRYRDSEGAWVAAMRAAQLTQSLGDAHAAAKAFARIGAVYADKPTVPALASIYEARAYEAIARWADALQAYRAAFDAWPANDNPWMGLDWKVRYFSDPFVESLWPREINRRDVARRIEVLSHVVAIPAQGEMERASWLLDHRRSPEARDLLLRIAQSQPAGKSAQLMSLLHRAEFDMAVSGISRNGRLSSESKRALIRLCGEPFDVWVGIGCAIHASVLAADGRNKAADTELNKTLRSWIEAQGATTNPRIADNEIVRDAVAIRDLLFQPDGPDGLRGQSQSYTPPPFIFIPSVLRITTGQGAHSHDTETQIPVGRSNVIVLSEPHALALWDTVERLSGCDNGRRSERLYRLWYGVVGFSKMLCALAGSWYTAPLIGPIHFMNPDRTRARVVVIEGAHSDGGHVAVVEKLDGEWKATGRAESWQY